MSGCHSDRTAPTIAAGLRVLPLQAALERRYIQYNPPAIINWLAFDIDRPYVNAMEWPLSPETASITVVNEKLTSWPGSFNNACYAWATSRGTISSVIFAIASRSAIFKSYACCRLSQD